MQRLSFVYAQNRERAPAGHYSNIESTLFALSHIQGLAFPVLVRLHIGRKVDHIPLLKGGNLFKLHYSEREVCLLVCIYVDSIIEQRPADLFAEMGRAPFLIPECCHLTSVDFRLVGFTIRIS